MHTHGSLLSLTLSLFPFSLPCQCNYPTHIVTVWVFRTQQHCDVQSNFYDVEAPSL